MRISNEILKSKIDTKGYTLIELIAVLVLLGVIALIAILSVAKRIEKAKEEVCKSYRMEISQTYKLQLQFDDLEHNEMTFNTYLLEIDGTPCPENGKLVYKDGVILCNIHSEVNDFDYKDENDVIPFL